MSVGFAAPGVLFLGAVHPDERNFCAPILKQLRGRGYTRVVEPCSGALAMALVAVNQGWLPEQIEASDVSLFSSILGAVVAGTPMEDLGVRLDGEPVELEGEPLDQAATLLYTQLLARTEANPPVDYWKNLVRDIRDNADDHKAHLRKRLVQLSETLGGVKYRPLDLWVHLDEVMDDPHTVVLNNPPSFTAGFEKFYDTKGRLTWNEPTYEIFDPETDYPRFDAYVANRRALVITLEEHMAGGGRTGRVAVYGRAMSGGKVAYLHSNRPDEIFEMTGGPKLASRSSKDLEPSDLPTLPMDYEITPESRIEVKLVQPSVSDYYREIWLHRLNAQPGAGNILVTIDGYVGGVIGINLDSMTRPYPNGKRSLNYATLRYALGAPHNTLRMGRLVTMLAMNKQTARCVESPANALHIAASHGLITQEMTRHPEAKGLRGLMKQTDRVKHPDGWKLTYHGEWRIETYEQTVAEFLKKEAAWHKARG